MIYHFWEILASLATNTHQTNQKLLTGTDLFLVTTYIKYLDLFNFLFGNKIRYFNDICTIPFFLHKVFLHFSYIKFSVFLN